MNAADRPLHRLLTVAEVAYMTRLSRPTVYRLLRSGEIPSLRFGRSYRVAEEAVDEYIARAARHNRQELGHYSTNPEQPPPDV